jgi:hypothetical protein
VRTWRLCFNPASLHDEHFDAPLHQTE